MHKKKKLVALYYRMLSTLAHLQNNCCGSEFIRGAHLWAAAGRKGGDAMSGKKRRAEAIWASETPTQPAWRRTSARLEVDENCGGGGGGRRAVGVDGGGASGEGSCGRVRVVSGKKRRNKQVK